MDQSHDPRWALAWRSGEPRHLLGGLDHWLARRLLAALHDPPVGIVLCDGREVGAAPPAPRLRVRDRMALYRLVSHPGLQFGDLFSDGRLDIEGDLVAFLEAIYRSAAQDGRFSEYRGSGRHHPHRLSPRQSRANVHHHYDIGNDFYRLWLDEAMLYTCAYFPRPDATLEEAQQAKMEHVCRKLRLQAGETVVEAGCGWGGLALYMAQRHGVRVRAFNLSQEQVEHARRRGRDLGLGGQVEFVLDDYRQARTRCDAFVSVGMLEHVGPQHYRDLGELIDHCLAPHGRGLIHTIGRNCPLRMNEWITTRIFPGGYTPSLGEITQVLEPVGLSVLDVENLRLHYALTLRHWLARFDAQRAAVQAMFDARFVRLWRLYLAGSLAAFTTGWMQLFQVLFARPTLHDLPLTREHLYRR